MFLNLRENPLDITLKVIGKLEIIKTHIHPRNKDDSNMQGIELLLETPV
jgi:hypothetical protein